MAVALLCLYLLWITPVRAGAMISGQSGEGVFLCWGVMVWGIRRQGAKRLIPPPGVQPLPAPLGKKKRRRGKSPAFFPTVRTLWRSAAFKGTLQRALTMEHAWVALEAGFADAAVNALTDAFFKVLGGCIRKRMVLCSRARFDGKSSLRSGCIVRARLGNLFLVGAVALLVYGATQRKEKGRHG